MFSVCLKKNAYSPLFENIIFSISTRWNINYAVQIYFFTFFIDLSSNEGNILILCNSSGFSIFSLRFVCLLAHMQIWDLPASMIAWADFLLHTHTLLVLFLWEHRLLQFSRYKVVTSSICWVNEPLIREQYKCFCNDCVLQVFKLWRQNNH